WRMMVDEIHTDFRDLGLRERQIDGLLYAMKIGYISRKDYAEITGVSLLTATRDMTDMVQKDLLLPEGAGRNRRYNYIHRAKDRAEERRQQKLF
ncbi:MAG: hypothetical protein V3S51_03490, partial [Dehalococcoidia bacterium]